MVEDKKGLLSLVQMGVLEIHPWGSKIDQLQKPDIITFDLDPDEGLEWMAVVDGAFEVKRHLEELGLISFVKTTGGKGLHVVIPIKPHYEWQVIKQFAKLFVQFLENKNPSQYTSSPSKTKRKNKIFLDYLRNLKGATAIAAYSTRAKPHAPVATPVAWEELSANFEDTFFTIDSVLQRLKTLKADPWGAFDQI